MRCAWPVNDKGNHKTMDCYRPVKTGSATANFPKAKEYQKMTVAAYGLEEVQKDLYMEASDRKELRDTTSEESDELSSSQSEEE